MGLSGTMVHHRIINYIEKLGFGIYLAKRSHGEIVARVTGLTQALTAAGFVSTVMLVEDCLTRWIEAQELTTRAPPIKRLRGLERARPAS
jgi:hypothetical protein